MKCGYVNVNCIDIEDIIEILDMAIDKIDFDLYLHSDLCKYAFHTGRESFDITLALFVSNS